MPLTYAKIQSIRPSPKTQKFSDGGGLQLWVTDKGSKLWRYGYRFAGKQKVIALGRYPEMSLADARNAKDLEVRLRKEGVDPSEARKTAKKAKLNANAENQELRFQFRTVAEDFIARQIRNGRADSTLRKTRWILNFANAKFGEKHVADILASEILDAIAPLETQGHYESARRLRTTIGCVFRHAIRTDRLKIDPTQALHGAFDYPAPTPYPAITDPVEFGKLLRAIDGYSGQPATMAALKLMPLLFTRPGELRAARWSEIDDQNAIWTIPGQRMKMRKEHRVPLCRQALRIFAELRPITGGGDLIFPSVRTTAKSISENTMNAVLRCLGYDKNQIVAHGFRSSASTLLNESRNWHRDAIERQLAHRERNAVRRVYDRSEHWNERIKMMEWWGEYLDELKAGGKITQRQHRTQDNSGHQALPASPSIG